MFRKGQAGESTLGAARAFWRVMCEKPLLPAKPIYGGNNWHYAYGRNVSAETSLKDAALMAEVMPADPASVQAGHKPAPAQDVPVLDQPARLQLVPRLVRKVDGKRLPPAQWCDRLCAEEEIDL